MGVDLRSQRIYARAHIVVHLFSTVSAILIAVFASSRRFLLAGLAIGSVLLFGGYSITNMIGFTSTNRVSVAAAKSAANDAEERHYQMMRKNKQEAIKWAGSTIVTADNPRERKRLEGALATLRAELDAIKPPKPTAINVYADPQATLFARLTGWTAEFWQMVLPTAIPVLLYGVEVLAFFFGTHLVLVIIGIKRQALPLPPVEQNNRSDSARPNNSDLGSREGGGSKGPRPADPEQSVVAQGTTESLPDPLRGRCERDLISGGGSSAGGPTRHGPPDPR